jgi:PadR family transcriptional regulator PadR
MKIDKELSKGSTLLLILKILSEQDGYGYQIVKELENKSDNAFLLKEGTLYPILHALESKELIESYWEDSDSLRKRKYYHITKQGQDHLKEKQREWDYFTASVNKVLRRAVYAK